MPSALTVSQLFITRQPLVELEGSGTRGFTLKFTSGTPVQCAARSRPVNKPEASLRDWPLVQEVCHGSLECSLAVGTRHATGLLGHLVVTLVDDVDLLICLGLDYSFQPLCIVMPFCKQTYNAQINALSILKAYDWITRDKDGFHQVFDSDLHIICTWGSDGLLESHMDVGLVLEVLDHDAGKHTALIDFQVEDFIRYYLPTADLPCRDPLVCLQRDDMEKMLQLESSFYVMRRDKFLCR